MSLLRRLPVYVGLVLIASLSRVRKLLISLRNHKIIYDIISNYPHACRAIAIIQRTLFLFFFYVSVSLTSDLMQQQ